MRKKRQSPVGIDISLPQPSAADLLGKQSVRATFKLSLQAIEALSVVAYHMGIKQKSLFDHLIEDAQSLRLVARKHPREDFQRLPRVQKTFVLSRRTLSSLETASRHFETHRDALVEYSIQRLLPIIEQERKKHNLRKAMLEEVNQYVEGGMKILQKSRALLGIEDRACQFLETALATLANSRDQLEDFVEKGKAIEEFE